MSPIWVSSEGSLAPKTLVVLARPCSSWVILAQPCDLGIAVACSTESAFPKFFSRTNLYFPELCPANRSTSSLLQFSPFPSFGKTIRFCFLSVCPHSPEITLRQETKVSLGFNYLVLLLCVFFVFPLRDPSPMPQVPSVSSALVVQFSFLFLPWYPWAEV